MELVFSFGTHSHIFKWHTHTIHWVHTTKHLLTHYQAFTAHWSAKLKTQSSKWNTPYEWQWLWRMSHFSFCKMSQSRPTFFIVKHKTAHKYAAKKGLFRYTQRTVHFLPRRLLFTRLNPTSSIKMYWYNTLAVSCSWIRWHRQHENASYSMDTERSTQWATVRHCRKTILDYRYNTCMCQCWMYGTCPPLPPLPPPPPPPPLTLTPLLLWLSISSKFSIVHQTKQRLKALLCCSPDCKLLNRSECLEIWVFVCCRLMLWDFTWEVCATTEHCV